MAVTQPTQELSIQDLLRQVAALSPQIVSTIRYCTIAGLFGIVTNAIGAVVFFLLAVRSEPSWQGFLWFLLTLANVLCLLMQAHMSINRAPQSFGAIDLWNERAGKILNKK